MSKRIELLTVFCLAFVLLCTASATAKSYDYDHDPYVQNVTKNNATIMWQTSVSADSMVEFGLTTSYGNSVYDSTETNFHEVVIGGLDPDTPYHYRTSHDDGSGPVYSADSAFVTAPAGTTPFTLVAHTDSQTYADIYSDVCNSSLALGPQLAIHCGDITAINTDEQWNDLYFTPAAPLIREVPMYPSMGNHERSGANRYLYFDVPDGGGKEAEQWYSFDYSNVHLISLDTNANFSPGSDQYEWLVNDLESTTAEWIFVYHHEPAYNSWSTYDDVINYIVPLCEQYDVDISFSGHIHFYERSYKDGVYYIVVGNSGGDMWEPRYDNPYGQYAEACWGFVSVSVDGSTATIEGRYQDGAVFDTCVISH